MLHLGDYKLTKRMRTLFRDEVLAGVDNRMFDTRIFEPSRDDIENACRFFQIGKIQEYSKEHGLQVSHSNFISFVQTTRGRYALKFYPREAQAAIVMEQAVNRILIENGFATPLMLKGRNGQASLPAHGRLAVCYAYADGSPAWKHIHEAKTIRLINSALVAMKEILSANARRLGPSLKPKPLNVSIDQLAKSARALGSFPGQDKVNASLLEACRTYQQHRTLFIPRWLHNNAGLGNFLMKGSTVVTLDLSHVCPDYEFSDLAGMIISCLFFNVAANTMDAAAEDYCARHGAGHFLPKSRQRWHQFPVLRTLVKLGLVKEYLKNAQRQLSLPGRLEAKELKAAYGAQLSKRQRTIAAAL